MKLYNNGYKVSSSVDIVNAFWNLFDTLIFIFFYLNQMVEI